MVFAMRTPSSPKGGLPERDRLVGGAELQVDEEQPFLAFQHLHAGAPMLAHDRAVLVLPGIQRLDEASASRPRLQNALVHDTRPGRSSQKFTPFTNWCDSHTEL